MLASICNLAGTKRPHLQLASSVCKSCGSCPSRHLAQSRWPLTANWQLRRETRGRGNKWKSKKACKEETGTECLYACWHCDTESGTVAGGYRLFEYKAGEEDRDWHLTDCVISPHPSLFFICEEGRGAHTFVVSWGKWGTIQAQVSVWKHVPADTNTAMNDWTEMWWRLPHYTVLSRIRQNDSSKHDSRVGPKMLPFKLIYISSMSCITRKNTPR